MRNTAFFKTFLVLTILMMPTLAFSKDKKRDKHSSKTDKSKLSDKSNQGKSQKNKNSDKKSASNDKSGKSEKEKDKEEIANAILKAGMERGTM